MMSGLSKQSACTISAASPYRVAKHARSLTIGTLGAQWRLGTCGEAWIPDRWNTKEDRLKTTFLEFEQPVSELEAKIEELRFVQDDSAIDISEEIGRLQKKSDGLTKDIYAKL